MVAGIEETARKLRRIDRDRAKKIAHRRIRTLRLRDANNAVYTYTYLGMLPTTPGGLLLEGVGQELVYKGCPFLRAALAPGEGLSGAAAESVGPPELFLRPADVIGEPSSQQYGFLRLVGLV